jgi:hypothetical protein
MKRIILALIIMVFSASYINAQTGQFAVVRPDGTTYICPTMDSAYIKAVNGDYIYLPGGTITFNYAINKKLFIFGAGHHPDSSLTTGKTNMTSTITFESGANGGSIEGIISANDFRFHYTGNKINNYVFKRCRIRDILLDDQITQITPDSFPSNILISECILDNINVYLSTNDIFQKNIIRNAIWMPNSCLVKNNTFLKEAGTVITGGWYTTFSNNNFENNVFCSPNPIPFGSGCNNNYYNNLKVAGDPFLFQCSASSGIESGTISVASVSDIFVAFEPLYSNFPYIDNYHLKPTCPGVNAGTDGTDVGIYGTSSPTNAGWVPSNPHIYYKQVAPETNTSGQLNIQFKVRSNN